VAFDDLREFVAHLEKTGQLKRVRARVSRDLEIAEITDRVSKGPAERNQALLFESVEGFDTPLLINAFGSPGRMAAALGVEHLRALRHAQLEVRALQHVHQLLPHAEAPLQAGRAQDHRGLTHGAAHPPGRGAPRATPAAGR